MPHGQLLFLFVLSALALLLSPGPAVLYVVQRSVHEGRRAGLVSTLGLSCGGLLHVAAAVLGLSALLAASAAAYAAVKLAGAAYLVYLGIKTLVARPGAAPAADRRSGSLRRAFVDGVVVNALNPKAALFFIAFLPQFTVPDAPLAPQILFLGSLLVLLGLGTDSLYAWAAGSLGDWLKRRPGFVASSRFFAGGTYIALGLTAAWAGRRAG